jgi:hypothetical protein
VESILWSCKFPRTPGSASSILLSISIAYGPTSGSHLILVHLKKMTNPKFLYLTPGVARGGRWRMSWPIGNTVVAGDSFW